MKLLRLFCLTFLVLFQSQFAYAQLAIREWENWLTDFSKHSVPLEEIFSGGPPKDGIPSIINPKFVDVGNVEGIGEKDPVMSIAINGDARAYPLSVLMWHEIVNDVVGDKPIVVTYCPLCNSTIVFDGELNGKRTTFGTTGRLRNSDMVMYDRQTETWWQQFSGEAIVGKLTGTKLKVLPSRLESFARFKKRHPKGKVLVPREKDLRDYGRNPYVGYDSTDKPFLFKGKLPENIEPMTYVIAVRRDSKEPLLVTLEKLQAEKSLELEGVSLAWFEGKASALDTPKISNGREIGNIVVEEAKTKKDMAYDLTFAFVAHAFHPEVAITTKDGVIGGPKQVQVEDIEPPKSKVESPKVAEQPTKTSEQATKPAINASKEGQTKTAEPAEEVAGEVIEEVELEEITEDEAETADKKETKKIGIVPVTSPRKSKSE